jgi:hypothetical protein
MAHKKWICFDFDGVLATYNGWKGFDVLGKPIEQVIYAIRKLKEQGFCITILTTRLDTPTMRSWLSAYDVPYDSINSNAHNPPNTSQKPIFDVIVDDRAVRYEGQGGDSLLAEIEKVIKMNDERCKK